MSPSPTVELAVARWLERIEHVHDRIQYCHAWVELPHRHQQRGREVEVRLIVAIPGREIAVSHSDADVYLAVANAFMAARRQLIHAGSAVRAPRREGHA